MVRELIRLEGVHRAFGAVSVLDGINLRIDEGDRIGVVGHNGSGKPHSYAQSPTRNRMLGTSLLHPVFGLLTSHKFVILMNLRRWKKN